MRRNNGWQDPVPNGLSNEIRDKGWPNKGKTTTIDDRSPANTTMFLYGTKRTLRRIMNKLHGDQ